MDSRATRAASVLAEPQILSLTLTPASTGIYYTLPIQVGGKTFSVQVDTGSSDLWLTSSTCTDAPCNQISSNALYNPLASGSVAIDANAAFQIDYVVGSISGEIYWDELKVGTRTIPRQALAAANQVTNEDMSGGLFSGVMGLALPGNSIIANSISDPYNLGPLSNLEIDPPAIPADDGSSRRRRASLNSSSPSLSPRAALDPTLPDSVVPFLTLVFGREGDPRIASQLGLRSHLPLVCDSACTANLTYTKVIESPAQVPLFWRATVQAIDVVDATTGSLVSLPVGSSRMPGQALPVGLLDSGAMGIYFTSLTLVNGIYGSVGIGPADDGFYYLPCTTPLQLAITIGNVRVPVHPLDISDYTASDGTHRMCMGSIQHISPSLVEGKGDFILGAAFMRNVYSVLSGPSYTSTGKWTTPSLALLPLTTTNGSLEEFHRVRVLGQDIIPSTSTEPAAPGASGLPAVATSDASSSVSTSSSFGTGPIVGVAIGGLILVAVAIFLLRYLCLKRKFRRNGGNAGDPREKVLLGGAGALAAGAAAGSPFGDKSYAYVPAAPSSPGSSSFTTASETSRIRDVYRDRQERGSVGSSTLRSFSESEDEGKGGWVGGGAQRNRKSSASSDKFTGNGSSRKGSYLGGGYEDVEIGTDGIMGTDAPTRRFEDDEDEDNSMASLAYSGPTDPLSTVDGYAAVPIKAWRIQDDGQPSPSASSSRPRMTTRSPSESSLSAADSLLLARREARRSRTESSSAGHPDRASSSNLSSTSTLHLGPLPVSAPHHFYPPSPGHSVYSTSSSQPSPSLPIPSPSRRPSLSVFFSNLTSQTIIESPIASPILGVEASANANRPPSPPSRTRSSSIPRGPNHRASVDSTRSGGFTESPGEQEARGPLLEGT